MANKFLQHVNWDGKLCTSCLSKDFEADCIASINDTFFDVTKISNFQEYFNKINEINNKINDGVYKNVFLSSYDCDSEGCYNAIDNVFIRGTRKETMQEAARRLSQENMTKVRLEKQAKKEKNIRDEKEKQERALYEKLKRKYGEIK